MKRPSGKQRRMAVSTGQAARFCFVTSDTIVNWIKAGLLAAQRTAGGQYRILVDDLRTFMQSRRMSTRMLEDRTELRPHCWEFHAATYPSSASVCSDCVVKHLGALNCFKLMGLRPGTDRLQRDCRDCAYFKRWAEPGTEHGQLLQNGRKVD